MLAVRQPELSRSRLKALILAGSVTSAGAPVRDPAYHVAAGDTITIDVPEAVAAEPAGEDIALDIVFEDDDIIVIDKPSGLVVHPAAGHETGTLVNALIAHCGASLSGIGGVRRPGIVHRLDKDTTGLMVVAKNDRAHQSLPRSSPTTAAPARCGAAIWRSSGACRTASRHHRRADRPPSAMPAKRWRCATAAAKPSPIGVQEAYNGRSDGKPVAALLACQLETGRTHQIRVHLAHIGHPADRRCGLRTALQDQGEPARAWQPGSADRARPAGAHAYLLALEHPSSGKFCTGLRICRRIWLSLRKPESGAMTQAG